MFASPLFRLNIPPKIVSGGGGSVSWTLISSTSSQGSGTSDNTTSAIDTTGANLIVWCVGYSGGTFPAISDSKGNTWLVGRSCTFGGGNPKHKWVYAINPTVGSGHTFTAPAVSAVFCNIQVFTFAKSGGTPAFDTGADGNVITGNWASSAGVKPGSITPATATSVMLTAVEFDVNSTGIAVNSSFLTPNAALSVPDGLQVGYKIKANAVAENPTWTNSTGNADAYASMIDFT